MQLFSFLEIKFQNGAHLKKGLFVTYFSIFLVTWEKSPIGIFTPVKTRLAIHWVVYIFTQVNITTSPAPPP